MKICPLVSAWARMAGCAGGLTIALSNVEMFVVVKTFPNLEGLVGDHGIFWIYAGTFFIFFTQNTDKLPRFC